MKTYQDFLKVQDNDKKKMDFIYALISEHKSSDLYREAKIADDYYKKKNRTISEFRKLLYTMSGNTVPDNWSANWKLPSGHFRRFVIQEVQYLLANGATFSKQDTKKKLGDEFDTKLQRLATKALTGAVAFGFWNLDHLEAFGVDEFAPLYDEENGALMAGVRFWQIDSTKPLRATFYEIDGYTEYIWKKGKGSVLRERTPYILKIRSSQIDGDKIYDYENYPTFPFVPLWGNPEHQSELTGLREGIDCYDLIKSGFANDLDDASQIFWTLKNAGGMDDTDLAKFIERLKTVKATALDDGVEAEAHTVEVPYASRDALLDRINRDLYRDAMAVDIDTLAGSNATATQIKASFTPLNLKCDNFEYCINEFVKGILELAGIEDEVSFTRSTLVNVQDEIQAVIAAAQYLDDDYVTEKILNILGDGDKAEEILKRMSANELIRGGIQEPENPEEIPEEEE